MEYGDIYLIPSDHYGIEYCVDDRYEFAPEVVNGCLVVKEKDTVHGNGDAVAATDSTVTLENGACVIDWEKIGRLEVESEFGDVTVNKTDNGEKYHIVEKIIVRKI